MSKVGGIEASARHADSQVHPPVFLIGAPRSGTSLVYRALSLHPSAAYISNWLRRRPGMPALSVLNRIPRAAPALRLRYWFGAESNAYRYGDRRPLLERAFPAPVEGRPLFEACGLGDDEHQPVDADRLKRAFTALTRFGGGSTVVSKCIANNRHIAALARIFPNARFINLVRDGRAVAYSLSRVDWWEGGKIWWFGGTPAEWRAAGGDPWDLCARSWVEEVRAIESNLRAVEASRIVHISYEDVVADPIRSLGAIAASGGLPESAAWHAALGDLKYPNRNQVWRDGLESSVVDRIERVQAEELRRYGYR
jgi:hypothetical protein